VGFEATIPASERAKTVHALEHSATVTGIVYWSVIMSTNLLHTNLKNSTLKVNYIIKNTNMCHDEM
jgi:hypothetical protein